MSGTRGEGTYADSSGWWGPAWVQPNPLTLVDLISTGTLQIDVAAFLWDAIARRSSMVVVAGPSGAGKSTVLTALCDLLPPKERRIHVRGAYDPFEFLTDPEIDPIASTLMVNEISPHLPIYLWGPGVRRLLRATERGFRLLATAHGRSSQELIAQLAAYPLRIPPVEIAAFDLVVVLDARREGSEIRRSVIEIMALEPSDRAGIVPSPLLEDAGNGLDLEAAGSWLSRHHGQETDAWRDIDARVQALESVLADASRGEASDVTLPERLHAALSRCSGHT